MSFGNVVYPVVTLQEIKFKTQQNKLDSIF